MSHLITRTFTANIPGPRLLVFGAVHGNERCGPEAIARVIERLLAKELTLTCGSVTFVPTANPRAYVLNVRCIDEDLNRVFRHDVLPTTYERDIAPPLCAQMKRADVFLDLHSSSTYGPVSVFVDFPTARNRTLAAALGAPYALVGWPELYEENPYFESYDTTRYAYEAGISGVLLECGHDEDPASVDVAEQAIVRTLTHLGMLTRNNKKPASTDMRTIRMRVLGRKDNAGDYFNSPWVHLDRVSGGTVLATREDGQQFTAPYDGYILLPKHEAKAGGEWFYFGTEET